MGRFSSSTIDYPLEVRVDSLISIDYIRSTGRFYSSTIDFIRSDGNIPDSFINSLIDYIRSTGRFSSSTIDNIRTSCRFFHLPIDYLRSTG